MATIDRQHYNLILAQGKPVASEVLTHIRARLSDPAPVCVSCATKRGETANTGNLQLGNLSKEHWDRMQAIIVEHDGNLSATVRSILRSVLGEPVSGEPVVNMRVPLAKGVRKAYTPELAALVLTKVFEKGLLARFA